MGVIYREYEKSDILDLADIADDDWKINHHNIATTMLRSSNEIERCILAFDGNMLVGYIYGFALPNQILLPEFLYVLPEYRKQGIAKTLLNKLEYTTDCNASMIFYNKNLHDLYAKLGYQAGENLEVAIKEIGERKEEIA